VPALSEALRDSDRKARFKANVALTGIVGSRACGILSRAAKREKGFASLRTRFLTILKSPDVVDSSIRVLKAEPETLREAAAEFLGVLGDRRAIDPLVKALERGTIGLAAAEALADFGDKWAACVIINRIIHHHGGYVYRELFEDYSDLISEAVRYS